MQLETQQAEELPQCFDEGSFVEIGWRCYSEKYRFNLQAKKLRPTV